MRPVKTLITFIVGILIGAIVAVGGLGAGAYIIINKQGMMGKVEEYADDVVKDLEFTEEVKDQSILQYSTNLFGALGQMDTISVGELENTIGYSAFSSAIIECFGTNQTIVLSSTLGELPDNIINSLQLSTLRDNFDISFPNFPLFKNEQYMQRSVKDGLGSLDNENVDQFIIITYGEGEGASSKFMQKIGKLKMSELTNNMETIIKDSSLGELIKINENSEPIMKAIKDIKINELNDKFKNLTVKDVFKNSDQGVLGVIDGNTKLQDVPDAVSKAVTSANVYKMAMLGVFEIEGIESADLQTRSEIYNNSANTVMERYAMIYADPSSAAIILSSTQKTYTGSGILTQAELEDMEFQEGDTLIIPEGVTVTIEADTVFTMLFNVIANGELIIEENVMVDHENGYMYLTGNIDGKENIYSNPEKDFKKTATEIYPGVLIE